MKDKETEMNGETKLVFLNRIIHEEVLCQSALKINHGVGVVIIIIHLIRMGALNHSLVHFGRTEATPQLSDGSAWTKC